MKRVCIIITLSIITLCAERSLVIPELCESITRRTYLLSRLERMILMLRVTKSSKKFSLNSALFSHPTIITTIKQIDDNNSLQPLFDLWDYLKEYRSIDDCQLIHEFTKLTLSIPVTMHYGPHIKKMAHPDIKLSLNGITFTEAVTLRHYYAQRLKRPLSFLKQVKCKKTDYFEQAANGCNCLLITNYQFSHPEIKRVVSHMEQHNSLDPLLKLGNEFEKMKLIQDEQFQKQFMGLIFTTYRNLLINNASTHHLPIKKNTLELMAHLYDELEQLPLEQLLDAIDLLAEELPPLLEKYEFNSSMEWKTWLKKYWWVPLGISGLISYRIARVFYPHEGAHVNE